MPELRLILLVIGALFILGVVLFEVRRERRNRPLNKVLSGALPEVSRPREPTISLPDIHVRHPSAPLRELQISDADSMVGLRLDTDLPETGTAADAPVIAAGDRETIDASGAFPAMVPLAPLTPETTLGVVCVAPRSDLDADDGTPQNAAPDVPLAPPSAQPPAAPVVDWPPEATRRIYSLRVMSGPAERFQGRALRLALADEGFVHGAFDIYHKPAPDGRVVVSASSLTKPGTFDLATIDGQRFLGLSLFVVLPGPLAPRAAIDEMFRAGEALALRLQGALLDDRGRPVTSDIIAELRDAAAGETVT